MVNVYISKYNNIDLDSIKKSLCNQDLLTLGKIKSDTRISKFLFSRKMLYNIISNELGCYYGDFELYLNEYGRPLIHTNNILFEFSLSYSKNIVAIATSFYCDIGVDIENTYYSEQNIIKHLIYSEKDFSISKYHDKKVMISYWAIKESFLKMNGVGINANPTNAIVLNSQEILYKGVMTLKHNKSKFKYYTKLVHGHIIALSYPDTFQNMPFSLSFKPVM